MRDGTRQDVCRILLSSIILLKITVFLWNIFVLGHIRPVPAEQDQAGRFCFRDERDDFCNISIF